MLKRLCTAVIGVMLAGSAAAQGLPYCAVSSGKTPVSIWEPELNNDGDLISEPPTGDGRIVFIRLSADSEKSACVEAPADKLYTFGLPDSDGGGLAVNLRGNVQFSNGFCHFHGFYMNETVLGMHQGWVETYFGAVDKFQVVASGTFCQEE